MITVENMTAAHLAEVLTSAYSPDVQHITDEEYERILKDHNGIALMWDGILLAVCGIHWFWPGVGEAWIIQHNRAQEARVTRMAVYKAAKKLLEILLEKHAVPLQRLQATVRTDWPDALRLAERMGFERESVMKRYSPDGTDAYMYAMVPK